MLYLPPEVPFDKQTLAYIKCTLFEGHCKRKEAKPTLSFYPWKFTISHFNETPVSLMYGSQCQRHVKSSLRKHFTLCCVVGGFCSWQKALPLHLCPSALLLRHSSWRRLFLFFISLCPPHSSQSLRFCHSSLHSIPWTSRTPIPTYLHITLHF